jgi:hypothetical protein
MTVWTVLTLAAAAAAGLLLSQARARMVPTIAVIAAALQVLLAFRFIHLSLGGLPVSLVLGGALTACGVIAWTQSDSKITVTSATVVATVGAAQVLAALF